jgi:hypothetical protein
MFRFEGQCILIRRVKMGRETTRGGYPNSLSMRSGLHPVLRLLPFVGLITF